MISRKKGPVQTEKPCSPVDTGDRLVEKEKYTVWYTLPWKLYIYSCLRTQSDQFKQMNQVRRSLTNAFCLGRRPPLPNRRTETSDHLEKRTSHCHWDPGIIFRAPGALARPVGRRYTSASTTGTQYIQKKTCRKCCMGHRDKTSLLEK